jgi:Predicted sulfurtransferase
MNVRLKTEIISVGLPNFDRVETNDGRILPHELHEKLLNDDDVVLLDTRNTYETRLGTFHNAIELDINTFRAFPKAVSELDESYKDKEIVMFCTGGVRCEKASVIMKDAGFTNIKQLEGGILGYFEQVGGDYWDGECFVFDKRVALLPDLTETGTTICFACREPLTPKEQLHPAYVPGESCSYCIDRHQSQIIH